MKKLLLSISLFAAAFGYSQTFDNIPTGTGYYINKLIVEPLGSDFTNELIEIRGTPGEVVPEDLWLVVIEGDSNSGSFGKVSEEIRLGDGVRTFGENGILAIVCDYTDENTMVLTTNPYTALMDPQSSILTIALTGNDVTGGNSSNVTTKTPDIGYDGNLSDASASYMLISATSELESVNDIFLDGPRAGDELEYDGVIDASGAHTLWTLYDSVAFLDDDHTTNEDGGIERGYAQIVFALNNSINAANQSGTTSSNFIDYSFGIPDGSPHQVLMRQGDRTGHEMSDWIIGDGTGSVPDLIFSEFSQPSEYENWADLNTFYGSLNPELSPSLSTNDFSINGSALNAYPVPMLNTLTIDGADVESTTIYSLTGGVVAKGKQSVDVNNLASGAYILEVKSKGESSSTVIIK